MNNQRMLRTMSPKVRLNKFLRDCALGSRRKCEELITGGVVKINGETVTNLATLVDTENDTVEVNGEAIEVGEKIYVAANKPVGCLVTAADPHGRETLFDAVPGLAKGLFPVGRLDMDSEGLVLLTNDGKLGHRLAHPRYEVERKYEATVKGAAGDDLAEALERGIELEDGIARARECRMLERSEDSTVLGITLTEGRKREIRRMLAACGYEVISLKRTSFGGVGLGGLHPGRWRRLSREELRTLRRITAPKSSKPRVRPENSPFSDGGPD
jgi:23S rRNA pseudouridine2605 synthase